MQRIMNNPDDIVDEMLAGFVKCHSDIVKLVKTGEENPRGVVAAVDAPIADKVCLLYTSTATTRYMTPLTRGRLHSPFQHHGSHAFSWNICPL